MTGAGGSDSEGEGPVGPSDHRTGRVVDPLCRLCRRELSYYRVFHQEYLCDTCDRFVQRRVRRRIALPFIVGVRRPA